MMGMLSQFGATVPVWMALSLLLTSCQGPGGGAVPAAAAPYGLLAVAEPICVSPADLRFLRGAAAGNLAEVALGRVAQSRCETPQCRAFGQRMVADHTAALRQVRALAGRLDVSLPVEADTEISELARLLKALPGRELDRVYLNVAVDDHAEDLAAYTRQAQRAGNPDVRAFAARTLPMLKAHLQQATAARRAL